MTRSISLRLPITGSSSSFFAKSVRSRPNARSIGNVADHLGFRSRADLFLHFHAHSLEIETHLLQNVHRNSLPQFDEAQKQMLGAYVVMVKPVRFFASKRQNLLSPRCEII